MTLRNLIQEVSVAVAAGLPQVTNQPNSTLTAGDAGTTFSLFTGSDDSSITAGNGANLIFVFSNMDVVTVGSGANTLLAATNSSKLSLAAGNAFVFGNNNQIYDTTPTSVVSVNGTGNSVTIGNQPSGQSAPLLIFGQNAASASGNSYTVGIGNYEFFDAGTHTQIAAGAGNDTVVGTQGSANIFIGNGNELIGAGGTNNVIFLGAGDSTVFTGTGSALVSVGNGNDTFVLGGASNTLVLGEGNSAVFLDGSGHNQITLYDTASRIDLFGFDFAAAGGDLLRLGVALHTTSASVLATLVTATSIGSDTLVSTTSGAVLADFHAIGQQSVSQLLAANAIGV